MGKFQSGTEIQPQESEILRLEKGAVALQVKMNEFEEIQGSMKLQQRWSKKNQGLYIKVMELKVDKATPIAVQNLDKV